MPVTLWIAIALAGFAVGMSLTNVIYQFFTTCN